MHRDGPSEYKFPLEEYNLTEPLNSEPLLPQPLQREEDGRGF